MANIYLYPVSRPRAFTPREYKLKNTAHQRRSRNGTITVQARHSYRAAATVLQNSEQNSQNEIREILETSIAFLPNKPHAIRIAVAFQQETFYTGSFLKNPVLSVSVLLPDDSEAFHLIETGDLIGLIKSLTLKNTRLTDRDFDGRCLLNASIFETLNTNFIVTDCEQYAIFFEKPDICKFLIDKGADVDFLEAIRIRGLKSLMSVLESA